MSPSKISQICLVIITTCLVFYVLKIGEDLIIPFIVALLMSFAIISLSKFFQKKLNKFLSFVLSLFVFIGIFWIIGAILNSNIDEITQRAPVYKDKFILLLDPILDKVQEILKIDTLQIESKMYESLNNINLSKLFQSLAGGITSIISSAGIIFFYVIFILLEHRYFKNKLDLMITKSTSKFMVFEILEQIRKDVKSYFVIKTGISLITASASYFLLKSVGADFALFWAFLIFVFNFIPTIGSIIAVIFPLFFTFIQFGFTFYFLVLLVGLPSIQVLMGNIIEPKFMGNKLNLSPLVIILSLGFWGTLWGVAGMILSVPIMVLINIILSNIKSTKPLAMMLSEKGEIKTNFGEVETKKKSKLVTSIKNKFLAKK